MAQTTTHEMYCSQCDDHRKVKKTVPWQANVCLTCGSDVGEKTATQPV